MDPQTIIRGWETAGQSVAAPLSTRSPHSGDLSSYRPADAHVRANFRYWHVEALLNQASDLIERCLSELRELRVLDRQWAEFDITAQADQKELERANSRIGTFGRDGILLRARQRFFTESQGHFDTSMREAQRLYDYHNTEGQGFPGWTRAGQNIGEKRVQELERAMDINATAQRTAWAEEDSAHQRQLLADHEALLNQRVKLAKEGGPFAALWQTKFVLDRLHQSYQDAVDWAVVAAEGLRKIYGYPVHDVLPPIGTPMDEAISKVAIWLRTATAWLVAYAQRDQAFTRTLSLRSVSSAGAWSKLTSSGGHAVLQVVLHHDLFDNYDNVRFRGIAATLLGDVGRVPWSVSVSLPKRAIYRRDGNEFAVDQAELPACVLGRVENRTSLRPPEVCGLISLMNASPRRDASVDTRQPPQPELGAWTFEVQAPPKTKEKIEKLDDLVIEVSLVGVPSAAA